MKKILFLCLFLLTAGLFSQKQITTLEIGSKMPKADLKMKDVSGKEYSLNDLKKPGGLVVIFTANQCPFVLAWEKYYNGIYHSANNANMGMVLVNSNEGLRNDEDSYENMKKKSKESGYLAPYVVDKNHVLADAFGAKVTPHVFIFDGEDKLVYQGAINDSYEGTPKNEWVLMNLRYMATGKRPLDPQTTPAKGCSIKRVK